MRRIWRLIRVAVTAIAHALYASVVVRWLPSGEQALFRAQRQQMACRRMCRILGVHIVLKGALAEERAVLAVSNHLGVLDPLMLGAQQPVAFVGNMGMRSWPLVGRIAQVAGIIFVDRTRRTQTAAFVEDVQARIRKGVRVLVFPEGTTTHGDTLLPFKTGAFEAVAAMDDGAVLPFHIYVLEVNGRSDDEARRRLTWVGDEQSFAAHLWELAGLGEVHVEIRVGAPIAAVGRDRKELAQRAHASVRALRTAAVHRHGDKVATP